MFTNPILVILCDPQIIVSSLGVLCVRFFMFVKSRYAGCIYLTRTEDYSQSVKKDCLISLFVLFYLKKIVFMCRA